MLYRHPLVVLLTAALAGSTAFGQSQPQGLAAAAQLLKTGKPDQSLAIVEPIIARAMAGEAKDPDAICPSVAAAVLQGFLPGSAQVLVEDDWCEAMLMKGYALNELKKPAQAAEVLKALTRHDPNNLQYLSEYAFTVRAIGNLEDALALYQKTERLASRTKNKQISNQWQAVALRGQGFALSELKRWDAAQAAYQRSLKYDPTSSIAQHELQYIKESRGK